MFGQRPIVGQSRIVTPPIEIPFDPTRAIASVGHGMYGLVYGVNAQWITELYDPI